MVKCTFCSKTVELGKGIKFVLNSGKIYDFCCSKCRKNFKLKRDPRFVGWTRKKKKTNPITN